MGLSRVVYSIGEEMQHSLLMQPSLFIFRTNYVSSYEFNEKEVEEMIYDWGLPSPDEVTIKRGNRYWDDKLKKEFIPYMVYVNWKLNTKEFQI